jgi:hypothetical protein
VQKNDTDAIYALKEMGKKQVSTAAMLQHSKHKRTKHCAQFHPLLPMNPAHNLLTLLTLPIL